MENPVPRLSGPEIQARAAKQQVQSTQFVPFRLRHRGPVGTGRRTQRVCGGAKNKKTLLGNKIF